MTIQPDDDTTLQLDRDDISRAQSTRTCAHWLKIAKKSVSNSVWWNHFTTWVESDWNAIFYYLEDIVDVCH